MKLRAALVAVLAASLIPSGTASAEEGPILSGRGWTAGPHPIYSIDPNRQYTVTFTSEELKRKYAPYLVTGVETLQDLGVDIEIGGVTAVPSTSCPPAGTIQFDEKYRPLDGAPGMSRALPCYEVEDNSAWGGHVLMDSEYWTGWEMPEYMLRNVFPHELMHIMGLGHPNKDLDGDGKVEPHECEETSHGNSPTMCSPNGGYTSDLNAGWPGYYDRKGIEQMVANFGS